MTIELSYGSFSDFGLASGDPAGRPARPSRFGWIDDRDVVYLTEVAGPDREAGCTFTLETSRPPRNDVRGWKGLKFVGRDGRVLGEVGTRDDAHGPESFTVSPHDLDGGRLVFMKAGPSGAPADVYHLPTKGLRERKVDTGYGGLQPVGGLSFLWDRDSR